MNVDDLVQATAALRLGFHCCDSCCTPRFVYLPDDPPEAVLSASSRRRFYVVKKGAPGGEAIYSHWDLAKPHVDGVSSAEHKSCSTADQVREMWARYCHGHHSHSPSVPPAAPPARVPAHVSPSPVAPPPYQPVTPPTSPRLRMSAPTMGSPRPLATASVGNMVTPVPTKFYRVSGSPRVLIHAAAAEAELRASGAGSLLVGRSLADVEDDDEVAPHDAVHFYRVFGSPRVLNNRDRAVMELVATQAAGLLVGDSLDDVDEVV
ncbi:hypothetical protein B0H13DRAFT_2394071 [Mycena leptocephala]|nr:hypothetical protein B0H13DRAFT_2394071 [Mycena leptocephala]